MTVAVTIREPQSIVEYRASIRVIADAWRAGFADIVNEAAFDHMDRLANNSESASHYALYRSHEGMALRVACLDEAVIGVGSVIWAADQTKEFVDQTSAEIRTLYVHPAQWRAGIGSDLLDTLCELPPRRFDRVVLETFTANSDGRSFYRSNGFTPTGKTTFSIAGSTYQTVIFEKQLR